MFKKIKNFIFESSLNLIMRNLSNLMGIVMARKISKATMSNIKQNLFFAFFYNYLGIPIAAGVLYPFFGILLSPMIPAGAIGNALRLKKSQA
jgi:cation transport ATPase